MNFWLMRLIYGQMSHGSRANPRKDTNLVCAYLGLLSRLGRFLERFYARLDISAQPARLVDVAVEFRDDPLVCIIVHG